MRNEQNTSHRKLEAGVSKGDRAEAGSKRPSPDRFSALNASLRAFKRHLADASTPNLSNAPRPAKSQLKSSFGTEQPVPAAAYTECRTPNADVQGQNFKIPYIMADSAVTLRDGAMTPPKTENLATAF